MNKIWLFFLKALFLCSVSVSTTHAQNKSPITFLKNFFDTIDYTLQQNGIIKHSEEIKTFVTDLDVIADAFEKNPHKYEVFEAKLYSMCHQLKKVVGNSQVLSCTQFAAVDDIVNDFDIWLAKHLEDRENRGLENDDIINKIARLSLFFCEIIMPEEENIRFTGLSDRAKYGFYHAVVKSPNRGMLWTVSGAAGMFALYKLYQKFGPSVSKAPSTYDDGNNTDRSQYTKKVEEYNSTIARAKNLHIDLGEFEEEVHRIKEKLQGTITITAVNVDDLKRNIQELGRQHKTLLASIEAAEAAAAEEAHSTQIREREAEQKLLQAQQVQLGKCKALLGQAETLLSSAGIGGPANAADKSTVDALDKELSSFDKPENTEQFKKYNFEQACSRLDEIIKRVNGALGESAQHKGILVKVKGLCDLLNKQLQAIAINKDFVRSSQNEGQDFAAFVTKVQTLSTSINSYLAQNPLTVRQGQVSEAEQTSKVLIADIKQWEDALESYKKDVQKRANDFVAQLNPKADQINWNAFIEHVTWKKFEKLKPQHKMLVLTTFCERFKTVNKVDNGCCKAFVSFMDPGSLSMVNPSNFQGIVTLFDKRRKAIEEAIGRAPHGIDSLNGIQKSLGSLVIAEKALMAAQGKK